ncbi:MAG: preprotein translocase subunit SecA [Oscillospiraceae bacterium]|nr:preprotein translocase subunit SecA [Oscillospiraceae bacterium]
MGIISKLFGTYSDRELKRINSIVDSIEALEHKYSDMPDFELRSMTGRLKDRLAKGESLDDILADAYATVREAAYRVIGQKAFRVQLIGAVVLHQGRIAEMKTGEGKTLTATFPSYLNALTEKGVHVVTVNDYLARYHSEWMGKIHRYLGLTVGLVIHDIPPDERKASYDADITYGTNNEFGFDYLRDNMAIYKENMVQRGHNFSIVDEVDSILIDEARTPLIISGQGDKSTEMYDICDRFASMLKPIRVKDSDDKELQDNFDGDYIVDEKSRSVTLTASGIEKAERSFNIENLSDAENTTLSHHINQAIRARGLMKRDVDYVVKDGEVIIVDEFTGRLMFGRRYSEGLHQAIEAKENVKVERESKTLATITFQNYFRLYDKLAGMTGTALTEEEEFREIYKMDVIEIPTNRPLLRNDRPDVVYKTEAGKMRAIVKQIEECHKKGQPVLVGTVSIEKSEEISSLIKKLGIKHNVLNAKHHEQEADIIAQAGQLSAVTIATNMAGRGTDIMLGGNAEYMARHELRRKNTDEELIAEADGHSATDDEAILSVRAEFDRLVNEYKQSIKDEAAKVIEAGGLFIVGTERHESRRIDNQLRGRAGRQGDPGETRFFISMEDDLMRLFGSERISGMMGSLGIDEDTPIDQKILSNALESAQKRIESRHYQTRKTVLEYDDVMNLQREVIYGQRRKVLDGEDLSGSISGMINESITRGVEQVLGESKTPDAAQLEELAGKFEGIFLGRGELRGIAGGLAKDALIQALESRAAEAYQKKEKEITPPIMRELERVILLREVDSKWMDHIDAMQELRQGIGLRAYGQNDPKIEYKREGFDMFDEMISAIRDDTIRGILTAKLQEESNAPRREQVARPSFAMHGSDGQPPKKKPVVRKGRKIGRNELCPCGSGLKYKKCHGLNEEGFEG